MRRSFLRAAVVCVLGLAAAGARAEYRNPVVRGVNPDPSIVRVGQDYYLVTSSMFFYPGCPIYHSRDLVNWRLIGHALTRPSQFRLEENRGNPMMYAATLRYHDGTFYVITTDVGGGGNFFVTAKDPAGPWSDPVFIDRPVFDPSLFFDDDGKVYYTRRGDMRDKDIVQAEIDIKTGKLLTPLRAVSKGMVSDDAEGPHLYKIHGWYYLSQGEGGSRFLHMQTIGRSRSPWGPFAPCPHNPFIAQHNAWWHPVKSIGHADLVDTPDGRWWAVYLGTRHASYGGFSTIGRETFLAPVEWVDDWPVVKPEYQYQLDVHAPTLPSRPWPAEPARDDFSAAKLDLPWTLLAYPHIAVYTLAERPGFLRLKGQPDGLLPARQVAFVGRRQQEFTASAATRMEFAPASSNEEAGVAVFVTKGFHYEIFKTRRGAQTVVVLRKNAGDIRVETDSAAIGDGPLWLRVASDADRYRFSYAEREGEWKPLGSALTKLIATEVADVWSGVLLGMYSTGNGKPCKTPADFDWFEYRNLP